MIFKRLKKLVFVCCLAISASFSYAQAVRGLGIGGGVAYLSIRDEGISVLNYQNFGYALNSELISFRGKNLNMLMGEVYYSKTKQGYTNVGILHAGKMDLLNNFLLKLNKPVKTDIYMGGSTGITGGYRYQPFFLNNAHNYDISLPVGISLLLKRDFDFFNKTVTLHYWFNVPLVAAVLKPAYATPLPEGLQSFDVELQDGIIRSIRILSMKNYTRLRSQISLTFPVTEKNLVRVSYNWDFYRILMANHLYFANHNINVSFVIGLRNWK